MSPEFIKGALIGGIVGIVVGEVSAFFIMYFLMMLKEKPPIKMETERGKYRIE